MSNFYNFSEIVINMGAYLKMFNRADISLSQNSHVCNIKHVWQVFQKTGSILFSVNKAGAKGKCRLWKLV